MSWRNSAGRVWLGYGLAAAAIVCAARYLGLNGSSFVAALATLEPAALLVAVLAFAVHMLINSLAFARLNQALGVNLSTSALACGWSATLLAKYVPGGFWHIIGRGLVLAKWGVPARTTLIAGVAEQGMSLALCTLFAAAFLWLPFTTAWWKWSLPLIGIGALFFISPRAVRLFAHPLDSGLFRAALMGYAIALLPYALGYLVIASPQAPLRFLGAVFGGTVAGVVAIPVPGGLGVRESVTALLATSTDRGPLLAALIAARGVILGVEVVLGMTSLALLRKRHPV